MFICHFRMLMRKVFSFSFFFCGTLKMVVQVPSHYEDVDQQRQWQATWRTKCAPSLKSSRPSRPAISVRLIDEHDSLATVSGTFFFLDNAFFLVDYPPYRPLSHEETWHRDLSISGTPATTKRDSELIEYGELDKGEALGAGCGGDEDNVEVIKDVRSCRTFSLMLLMFNSE